VGATARANDADTDEGHTVQIDRLPERLTEQVDKVRDRTAEAVGADGGSILREIAKLGRHLDSVEDTITDRLDDIDTSLDDTEGRIGGLYAEARGTTWPRRLFWLLVGAGAGAAAAYFADPDRGQVRREEVVGQASTRVREVKDEVVHRAEDVKEQAIASGNSVKSEAQRAAEDVAHEAQHAADDVRAQVETSAQAVADEAQRDV
jgi:gas vesicle protein